MDITEAAKALLAALETEHQPGKSPLLSTLYARLKSRIETDLHHCEEYLIAVEQVEMLADLRCPSCGHAWVHHMKIGRTGDDVGCSYGPSKGMVDFRHQCGCLENPDGIKH